jgi:hypothetical protein
MPSTIITKETLEQGITKEEVQILIELRLKAGAIRCWEEGGVLMTEWNVLGE